MSRHDATAAAAGGGGMRRRPEWSDEEMMMTREIFLLNMTPWHFRRKMENFQRTTITIGWTGVACRRRPSRRISVMCSGAHGIAGSQWNPRSILSIEVHHTSSIKTRWLKLEFGNESQSTAPPLCIPMLAQSAAARRSYRCRHCRAAQDDIHEKKDKNTPLNEFPSGWLLKRLFANFLWLKTTFPFQSQASNVKRISTLSSWRLKFFSLIILLQTSLCML